MKRILHEIKTTGVIAAFCIICFSCKKFVIIDPPTSALIGESVFAKDESAIAAINGLYQQLFGLTNFASGSNYSVTYIGSLASDDLQLLVNHSVLEEFSNNEISIDNGYNTYLWTSAYNIIYQANAILEGLASSNAITTATKKQLQGEAKFMRAYCHFYLVNLFGPIPIVTNTNYETNTLLSRNSTDSVYNQIEKDLVDARDLLVADYPVADRVRPNKFAAMALLARAYLYQEKWEEAEQMANDVITTNAPAYKLVDDLNEVFLIGSAETIWSIPPGIANTFHTKEASVFISPSDRPTGGLTPGLIAAFETGDGRLVNWIQSGIISGTSTVYYYPYKYKDRANNSLEYAVALRLAEQYLIRAEAKINQNRIDEGVDDLNELRDRARGANPGDLPSLPTGLSKKDALLKVEHERRVELFTEWGHRWFDLKRTGRATTVLSSLKTMWQQTDVLFPIPDDERNKDPNLSQNLGY